jgi:CheY-like chemotaxis protein
MVRNRVPDLIILDMMMPGMNGVDVLRELRNDPRLAAVPVLLYSADTDREHLADAVRLGVHRIIPKPGWSELISEVKAIAGTN